MSRARFDRIESAGGGGYGGPRERHRVERDVLYGYVSPEQARKLDGYENG